MKSVRITVKKMCRHDDLIELYENPMIHQCDMEVGMEFVSHECQIPEGMCQEAWKSIVPFVMILACGGVPFDDWMKDPKTAMISCNDGFRPVSFYLEALDP